MDLNENFKLSRGIDYSVYYDNYGKGWRDLADANFNVPFKHRDKVTVLIGDVEYWWKGGITDADLVVKDENDITPIATTTVEGKVKQAAAQADNATANAPAISATYVQAEVQAIATLANALKTDLNGLLAKLRAAGILNV